VVIVGGEFAGLFAARALRQAPVQVTLIDLSLPDHPDILVTGDMMCLDKLPGGAEVAMQTGLYAARRITQEAQGYAYGKPFRYPRPGLGRLHLARARGRLRLRAAFRLLFGWVVWLFIHIGFLTGLRNRLGAIVSWWPAFVRDIRRERTFTIDHMPLPSGAYSDKGEPDHPANTAV
jgi:NADH dehydrogenase